MQYLKADTNTEVLIGPVVAVGDGFTPVTTLHGGSSNLAAADEAEIIKYGGATALTVTDISTNAMTPITGADGYYTLDISTSNTDTEGFLAVVINDDSLCLPVRHDFQVVNANVYDSMFAAATTDYLDVNTIQVGATTQTAGDIPALVTTVDTVVDGIQTDLSNGTDGLGAIKSETALILADTNELQTDWADGGRLDLIQDIIAADTTTDIPALIATAQADLDIITAADGVVISAAAVTQIWASVVESNASITAQQALSAMLAVLAGVTTSAGAVLKDPSGTTTRVTAVLNASNERTSMTLNV